MFPKLRKDRRCVGTSQNAINQLKICQKNNKSNDQKDSGAGSRGNKCIWASQCGLGSDKSRYKRDGGVGQGEERSREESRGGHEVEQ